VSQEKSHAGQGETPRGSRGGGKDQRVYQQNLGILRKDGNENKGILPGLILEGKERGKLRGKRGEKRGRDQGERGKEEPQSS